MAVIKGNGDKEPIRQKIQQIQNVFMELLCESNGKIFSKLVMSKINVFLDIVQDVASKGLCVIYDTYKSQDILTALVKQLTTGTRQVNQVTSDTKLFEEGQLGKSPIGYNKCIFLF